MSSSDVIGEIERRDRKITERALRDYLEAKGDIEDVRFIETEITDSIDLKCKYLKKNGGEKELKTLHIEIKERFKNRENMKKYPNAELKQDKYWRMRDYSLAQNEEGDVVLFYIVLLNRQKMLVFDLDHRSCLDMKDVFYWRIKRTQVDFFSEMVTVPTYLIPYEEAILEIDIEKYFIDYARDCETEKEEG